MLRLRFGIGERSNHTLEEVGKEFAVTRERIRQIEAKALRKLRHPSRAKRLAHLPGLAQLGRATRAPPEISPMTPTASAPTRAYSSTVRAAGS